MTALSPIEKNADWENSNRVEIAKLQGLAMRRGAINSSGNAPESVKEQFMAIFYKELLKKAIKMPTFGSADQKESLSAAYTSDILINKMALELAQSKSFSADNFFPDSPVIPKGTK